MKSIITTDNITLPEYIETNIQHSKLRFKIPTTSNVEARPVRRKIIETAYKTFLTHLQGNNFIKNDFLDENVYIIFRESYIKASNNAVRVWQTTYAVLKLPDVLKYAKPFDENYRSFDIKDGKQKKNRYVELIKLRYTFNSKTEDYKNFTIEVVIGKKSDGRNVQYSLEYIKKACS